MAKIELHPDFKDFLRLLNSHDVKYMLVGGCAVIEIARVWHAARGIADIQ